MGKTRGIGAPDDVLTIASQLECRRGEKNLGNIWEMSVESMKIARNRFYYYSFFSSPAQKTRGIRFDRLCSTRLRKKYGIEAGTRKEKLSPSSFIPNLNRPARQMNASNFIPR